MITMACGSVPSEAPVRPELMPEALPPAAGGDGADDGGGDGDGAEVAKGVVVESTGAPSAALAALMFVASGSSRVRICCAAPVVLEVILASTVVEPPLTISRMRSGRISSSEARLLL